MTIDHQAIEAKLALTAEADAASDAAEMAAIDARIAGILDGITPDDLRAQVEADW